MFSPLRLTTRDGRDLLDDLSVESAQVREITQAYELAVGKRIGRHEVTQAQQSITMSNAAGKRFRLDLRAADDGVAFRVVLSDFAGTSLAGSDTQLSFSSASAAWPLKYTPWYEEPRSATSIQELAEGDYGLPLLVQPDPRDPDLFVLLAESDVDGRYGGSFLHHSGGAFSYTLADEVSLGEGSVATPWRVLIMGSLSAIVESHLVEDLAPDAAATVPAWVRPGRGAWSWWSDFYSGAQFDIQRGLVDYAAEHGWEHVLVDCGWDRAWLPELLAYASARGVGIFVWVSWDWLRVESDLAEWASWGVAGIKVDFMESESQARYRWYDKVIAEAARMGLMVNFHGSVIPRGWARTHPHVMTYEAVRGAEYYVFYTDPFDAPVHNTIVPFSRNVVGSADYTPVTFSAATRTTSDAHELALAVVLESGLTHFADAIDEYRKRPLAQLVLDSVHAAWDETRLLGGWPGEWVALARRSNDDWFVGVISAGSPRTVSVDLPATLEPRVITDLPGGGLVDVTPHLEGRRLTLELAENGGAVIVPASATAVQRAVEPVPAPRVVDNLIVTEPGQTVRLESGDPIEQIQVAGPANWTIQPTADHHGWEVTAPPDAAGGTVAVLGLRLRDVTKRSPLAHVRVAIAPRVGQTDLVDAQPISVSNQCGPVERNQSNGGGDPFDGRPMSVGAVPYARGLGVSCPSTIEFALGGVGERLTALVGVDDETSSTGAIAEVTGDGRTLARHDLRSGEPAQVVDIDVRGVQRLAFAVHSGSGSSTHVDWIDPVVHRSTTK